MTAVILVAMPAQGVSPVTEHARMDAVPVGIPAHQPVVGIALQVAVVLVERAAVAVRRVLVHAGMTVLAVQRRAGLIVRQRVQQDAMVVLAIVRDSATGRAQHRAQPHVTLGVEVSALVLARRL